MIRGGGLIAPLALLAAVGCAGRRAAPIDGPYTLEHALAEWLQRVYIGDFEGYAPGEYCAGSDIIPADDTALGYGMLVRVSALGTTYVATLGRRDPRRAAAVIVVLTRGTGHVDIL